MHARAKHDLLQVVLRRRRLDLRSHLQPSWWLPSRTLVLGGLQRPEGGSMGCSILTTFDPLGL